MLERLFHIRKSGSTPGREALGGLTTFLTMAYIIFVNPAILGKAGIPVEGAILATCLAAAFATLLMAFLANYPIALAPGMGLNVFFTYTICIGSGVPWQTALGLCFWAGAIFLVLTVTGVRRVIVRAVPKGIKMSAAVGIGLFIALIGLKHAGIVIPDEQSLVKMGDVTARPTVLALVGISVTILLVAAKIRTAIFWGVLATVVVGLANGIVPAPDAIVKIPAFDPPGFQIDLWDALQLKYVPLLLVLLFFDIFDTLGTLMGVGHEAGLLKDGQLPRGEQAMLADALGTIGGAVAGTSTVTSFIESGSGVGVGARTGLANVVTALLFLMALLFAPVISVVGGGVEHKGVTLYPITAPALIIVGTLMTKAIKQIDWDDMTEALPAFFTMLLMPATFNISHGLAAGIIVYVIAKVAAQRFKEVHWLMILLALAFIARYAFLPVG